jgi:pimeloyl-ACP methyl ester carboxylesterase
VRAIAERERTSLLERLDARRPELVDAERFELTEADRAQLAKHRDAFADQAVNALRPGVDGWVDDWLAFTRSWGFDVGSIRVPVYLAYDRSDSIVPVAHGEWLAAHIPGAIVVVRDAGHMIDDASVEPEIAWLAGPGR